MIKARLLKPLDGDAEGTIREFSKVDFASLKAFGAVEAVEDGDELRQDGPTIAEYISAGYKASSYPPVGFAVKSTTEEIAEAVKAEEAAAAEVSGAKSAPPVANKAAPAVANKATSAPGGKPDEPNKGN